jgi:hypothetical protein
MWTIGRRLALGFSAVVAVALAVGAYAIVELKGIGVDTRRVATDSLPGTALSGQVMVGVTRNYGLTLAAIDAESREESSAAAAELRALDASVDTMLKNYERTITVAEDRRNFEAIGVARAAFVAERAKVLAEAETGRKADARTRFRTTTDAAYRTYLESVRVLSDWNIHAGEEVGGRVDTAVSRATIGVLGGLLTAAILALGVAWFVIRSTNGALTTAATELKAGADQVGHAAGQAASSSQLLAQGATEQAGSLEETSASMEEMAAMTRRNAENSSQAATLMGSVSTHVDESHRSLEHMVQSMKAIHDSSTEISRIIKTIDEIAFQTNILALNAAVEAARAGDAGMGFAVVAEEVRRLAHRSAQAAKDTAGLIEEAARRAEQGTTTVEQVRRAVSGITQSATELKTIVEAVSSASKEQSAGIEQVSRAIAQMEKVTQTTAASAEQGAASAQELSAQAAVSLRVIADLQSLVGAQQAA